VKAAFLLVLLRNFVL